MTKHRTETDAEAYQKLLDLYWPEGPGDVGKRFRHMEGGVNESLGDPERTDSVAVGLLFMASEELLVAGNLIAKGRATDGWAWMDRAQARAYWAHQVHSHVVWVPSAYTQNIFDVGTFCGFFSLALARGSEQQVLWYAQQFYNMCRGGVADASCKASEYVDFYWELAIAVIKKEWPSEADLSDDMGVYRDLFLSVSDTVKLQDALLVCAAHHLDLAFYTAPKNDDEAAHPFRTRFVGHIAYELMGWLALYKRLNGSLPLTASHPMLLADLLNPPAQQPYTDDLIEKLCAHASIQFGQDWVLHSVPSFDTLWPDK